MTRRIAFGVAPPHAVEVFTELNTAPLDVTVSEQLPDAYATAKPADKCAFLVWLALTGRAVIRTGSHTMAEAELRHLMATIDRRERR